MKTYQYYPGCSLRGTGRAFEESLLAVFAALDVRLHEIDDWNCCGATAYMSVDEAQAFALSARNLALADAAEGDVVAPCAACYLTLTKTQRYLVQYPHLGQRVDAALHEAGLEYRGRRRVRHPLEILIHDVGLGAIRERIVKPLAGLRIAPYYGCQLVRPFALFDAQANPSTMDQLLFAAGAVVLDDFPLKTRCCGGSQTGTTPEAGMHLSSIILKEAAKRRADLIAVTCPLCQFNLEAYQGPISARFGRVHMPVLYFTQILGLAMGLPPRRVSLQRCLVSARPVLARVG